MLILSLLCKIVWEIKLGLKGLILYFDVVRENKFINNVISFFLFFFICLDFMFVGFNVWC